VVVSVEQPPPDKPVELDEPQEGYEYRWEEDDYSGTRLATAEEQRTRKCRRPGCRRTPAIALMRGFSAQKVPWLYCDWHMYGRRIVDGRIEFPRLRKVEIS
jgi:hypothetical protein